MADERPMPTNVIAAITRVMEELPAIGKDKKSEQGYMYRGIEAITKEVQPLFAKYGITLVPCVLSRNVEPLTINNKPWTQDELEVEYTVYGPGGLEDCIKVGPIYGLGRDNSDKGANKSMTQAFKYALIQMLCIADAKDDGDQASHTADAVVYASADQVRELAEKIKARSSEVREQIKWKMAKDGLSFTTNLTPADLQKIAQWEQEASDDGDTPGSAPASSSESSSGGADAITQPVETIGGVASGEQSGSDRPGAQATTTGAVSSPAGDTPGAGDPGPEALASPAPELVEKAEQLAAKAKRKPPSEAEHLEAAKLS